MIKWMVMMILSENIENRFAHRASGVEDLEHALLAVDLDLLPVGVLDGGVVLLGESLEQELYGEAALEWANIQNNLKCLRSDHRELIYGTLSKCFLMRIAA